MIKFCLKHILVVVLLFRFINIVPTWVVPADVTDGGLRAMIEDIT